jgi:hypothetical protein
LPEYAPAGLPADEYAPVLPFDTFMARVFRWEQNQHVGIIGPTEQGKTNLAYHLLGQRSYVAYFGIKSEDDTLEAFARHGGYQRTMNWPPKVRKGLRHREPTWAEMPRRLIWPDARGFDAEPEQRRVFRNALRDIWASGRVCVVWDDFWYLSQLLGMERDAKKMLLNARSCWSPQVIIAQRAGGNRMVELVDQPTWLFWAKENDPRNLQLVGPSASMRRGFVENLDRYQFLAENTRTGHRYRITAPLLETAS